MMQNPVAANHSMATPTNPVNSSHQTLWIWTSTDATEIVIQGPPRIDQCGQACDNQEHHVRSMYHRWVGTR